MAILGCVCVRVMSRPQDERLWGPLQEHETYTNNITPFLIRVINLGQSALEMEQVANRAKTVLAVCCSAIIIVIKKP